MKKSIHPISVLRVIWLLIWLLLIGLSIATAVLVVIDNKYSYINIIALIVAVPLFVISLIIFCSDFKRGVKFYDNCITVSADFGDKNGLLVRRFQHAIKVQYVDIHKLYVVYSNKDSNSKPVENVFVNMPYIVMECVDGSVKAINVYYYSKKQRINLINEIRLRAEKAGNCIDCVSGEEIWK